MTGRPISIGVAGAGAPGALRPGASGLPSAPAVSSPYLIGTAAANSGTILSILVTTPTNTGDGVIVGASASATATVISVTDSAGNVYTEENSSSAENPTSIWVALNTVPLVVDSLIVVTFSSSGGTKCAAAVGASNLLTGIDQDPAAATSSGSISPSITTGTLSWADELAVALCVYGDSGGTSLTWASGWSPFFSPLLAGPAGQYTSMAWQSTTTPSPVTASGTITSAKWTMMVLTFPIVVTAGVTVTVAGAGTFSTDVGYYFPPPALSSVQCQVTHTPGNWLIACVSWRQAEAQWTFTTTGAPSADNYFTIRTSQAASIALGNTFTDSLASNVGILFTVSSISQPYSTGYVDVSFIPSAPGGMPAGDVVTASGATMSVTDDVHNWWFPLSPQDYIYSSSSAGGVTRTAIWGSPAARTPQYVMVAPNAFALAMVAIIYEVSGVSAYSLPALQTAPYTVGTSLTMSLAAPPSQSLVVTAASMDNVSDTLSLAADGWMTTGAAALVGVYFSETEMGVSSFTAANAVWTTWTGAGVPVTRVYLGSSYSYTTDMQDMVAAGVKMCVDIQPPYNPVSGTALASIVSLMQTLTAAGAVCDISLWHEPYYSGLTSAQFTSMIQYYGPSVRQYYPLVFDGSGPDLVESNGYYPGDAWVDKIACDDYVVSDASAGAPGSSIANAAAIANAASPAKPLGVWEFNGSTDPVYGQSQATVTAWFTSLITYMKGRLTEGWPNADVILYSGRGGNWLGNGATSADAGFETGTAGDWSALSGCTIAATTAEAHSGTHSLAITATSTSTMSVQCYSSYSSGLPVTAGNQVYVFAWYRAHTSARSCYAGVAWYTSGGSLISTVVGTGVVDSSSAWTQATATLTAPATAAYAVPVLQVVSPGGSGEIHYADDVSLSPVTANVTDLSTTIDFGWDYRISAWQTIYSDLNNVSPSPVAEISVSNPVNHSTDLVLGTAYQVTSGATVASWSSTGSVDFSGVMTAIPLVAESPAMGNSNWPYTVTELVLYGGPDSLPDTLYWTPITENGRSRNLSLSFTQGRQYMLDQLQAGQGTISLDDPDLLLIPPGSGAYAGIDSGTPARMRMAWNGGAWQLTFCGNGLTANPQVESSSNRVTVYPGVTYSVSAWLACSQPWSQGMVLNLAWFTSGSVYISSVASTPVTGPDATLAIATGAAPANAAYADYTITALGVPPVSTSFSAAAATPGSGFITLPPAVVWAAENGATITASAPWALDRRGAPNVTPWMIPFSGYFQRWPPTWDPDTYRGITQATITDVWGYANRQLQSMLREEILTDGPWGYWPLTDPVTDATGSATLTASNIAPGNNLPLTVTASKNGVAAAVQAFGAETGAIFGDQVTTITTSTRSSTSPGMWSQTGVTGGAANTGYALQLISGVFPPIYNGVTVSGYFWCTSATLATNGVLFYLSNGNGVVLDAFIDPSDGYLKMQYFPGTGGGVGTTVTIYAADFRNSYHLFHLAISFNQETYAAYLFGGFAVVTGSFSSSVATHFSVFSVCGQAGPVVQEGFFDGNFGHIAIHPYQVPQVRILSWYLAGTFGFAPADNAGEGDDARITRLLGYAGLGGSRVILSGADNGDVTHMVSGQDIGGQPAATSLTNIAASTIPAQFYVAPNGDIVYRQKSYVYNTATSWVLGDRPELGEIPFGTDYAPDYDPARVVNDIQLTQLDDQSVTVPDNYPLESASVIRYGDQSYQATSYLQTDQTLPDYLTAGASNEDLANWIADVNWRPYLRVATVSVNAASYPSAWLFFGTASPGDSITVNIRPVTAGGQLVSITGRITQTMRQLQFGSSVQGTLTCVADMAPDLNALTCDDPVRGQLDGDNTLGW
jgi:hypothetical protein